MCPEDAEVVLRAWSNFILNFKPKSLGEGNQNITIELVNKLEGVLVLVQRLNTKISSFSKSGMQESQSLFKYIILMYNCVCACAHVHFVYLFWAFIWGAKFAALLQLLLFWRAIYFPKVITLCFQFIFLAITNSNENKNDWLTKMCVLFFLVINSF